jgi:hypothetical protein
VDYAFGFRVRGWGSGLGVGVWGSGCEVCHLISLDNGAHGVFEELEEDVMEVLGDIRQAHLCRSLHPHIGRHAQRHLTDLLRVAEARTPTCRPSASRLGQRD